MKTNYNLWNTIAVALLFTATSFGQATIAQWNFNGTAADAIPGGIAAPLTSVGTGTASLVGVTSEFGDGNTTAGTTETETTTPPNYAWSSSTYAAPGTENKGRGVQFNVSTVNQQGITFKFEQRLSNKAANTSVVQYTTDATAVTPVWVDAQTFTFTPAATGTGDTWYNGRTVDLSAVTALDNNPNVAFRIVAAFDPVANDYLASRSTSTYDGTGKVRFDMVTVTSATSLGTHQVDQTSNAFAIYPNPSNKEVVTFNQTHDIEVYDASGKVVLKASGASSIDTRTFASGVYFIMTEEGVSKKLIVN